MKYEQGLFFRENDDPDVGGFTIIEIGNDEYRLGEKWERNGESDKWVSYWVPASHLDDRISTEQCERVGNLSDEQLESVCDRTDPRALESA